MFGKVNLSHSFHLTRSIIFLLIVLLMLATILFLSCFSLPFLLKLWAGLTAVLTVVIRWIDIIGDFMSVELSFSSLPQVLVSEQSYYLLL